MNKEDREELYAKRLKHDRDREDRDIIEEEAVVNWVDPGKPTRQIIHELMAYSASIALDPRVSKAAADLYHEGYLAGKTGAVNRLNEIYAGDDEVSL